MNDNIKEKIEQMIDEEFYQSVSDELSGNQERNQEVEQLKAEVQRLRDVIETVRQKSNLEDCQSSKDVQYALEEINDLLSTQPPYKRGMVTNKKRYDKIW